MKRTLIIACIIASALQLPAQTVSNFDSLTLAPDSYWDGSDFTGGFASGNAYFPNIYLYDSVYGGYWAEGFAYSNKTDSVTPGFGNMYSAITAAGVNGSSIYSIGQQGAVVRLTGAAAGKVVNGFYVTNSTYAALSMRDGDMFSKKFGGVSGDDPDWFKLSITGYDGCCPIADTVHFFLADYRFSTNNLDYIVNDWQWVDLTSLGNLDSLMFFLSSSDTGMFGMNTPPFFCIDDFTTADSPAGIAEEQEVTLNVFPNPASDRLNISLPQAGTPAEIMLFNSRGQCVFTDLCYGKVQYLMNTASLPGGIYFIRMLVNERWYSARFVKE